MPDQDCVRSVETATRWTFLVTCEHGGNDIPPEYSTLFRDAGDVLASHRGYDPGALELAHEMAEALNAALFTTTVSRMLIDPNRSLGHPALYSEITGLLPREDRQEIFARYYQPYRQRIEQHLDRERASGHRILHISVHSFTPVLAGTVRNADVGLLYDPKRPGEKALARSWQQDLQQRAPHLRIRRNYPYLGSADGLTSRLRKCHAPAHYLGFELELNQTWPQAETTVWRAFKTVLTASTCAVTTLLPQSPGAPLRGEL